MADLENDGSNKQTAGNNVQKEANIYEDEINLMDYFLVLWKRKYFILLGSVLPALIVGLIFYFGPRNYKVTYVYDVRDQSIYDVRGQSIYDVRDQSIYDVRDQSLYDVRGQSIYDVRDQSIYDVSNWNLNENNYKILLDRFYSAENTGKIATKLQENGLNKYAKRINTDGLKNFVDFEVSPPYTDLSKTKITKPFELEQIRQLEAQLLNMTITRRSKNNISKISSVIRDDFEKVMPVYTVKDQLNSTIRKLRGKIGNIEENRANQELALKTNKAILAKLKNIKTRISDKSESDIVLQFDISGKTEYLPAEYQTQAIESKMIQLEEQSVANEETYNYYKDLLDLNAKVIAELNGKLASDNDYTINLFKLFLIDLVGECKKPELKDYLASYIKKIENRISASAPVSQNPNISPIAKGTVKKSATVFAIALMLSMFAAFLLEGLKKSQAQAS